MSPSGPHRSSLRFPSTFSWRLPATARGRSGVLRAENRSKSPGPLVAERRMSRMRTRRSAIVGTALTALALAALAVAAPAAAEPCGPVVVDPLGLCQSPATPTPKPSSTPKPSRTAPPAPSAPPAAPAPAVPPAPVPSAPETPSAPAAVPASSAAPATDSSSRPAPSSTVTTTTATPAPPALPAEQTADSVTGPRAAGAETTAGAILLAIGGLLMTASAGLGLSRRRDRLP